MMLSSNSLPSPFFMYTGMGGRKKHNAPIQRKLRRFMVVEKRERGTGNRGGNREVGGRKKHNAPIQRKLRRFMVVEKRERGTGNRGGNREVGGRKKHNAP
eukprot:CAMPEP_0170748778 /NCGR_PEP_ID=MMETSP0437-20130122/10049_1 /TAXON_ID=0 /ORGANISM="Sexangularia sp." /LENGTH=99 /DNA_ID=CAMNT_0011087669 /DNA_START=278 /DNA_END=573 /DNA_ORIENTATION=+